MRNFLLFTITFWLLSGVLAAQPVVNPIPNTLGAPVDGSIEAQFAQNIDGSTVSATTLPLGVLYFQRLKT